jgi:hypothetical protein
MTPVATVMTPPAGAAAGAPTVMTVMRSTRP